MFNDIPVPPPNRLSVIRYKNRTYTALWDIINPERCGKRIALFAFKTLEETNNLHLVDEYMDCRNPRYDHIEYEKYREFREDLWARAREEVIH